MDQIVPRGAASAHDHLIIFTRFPVPGETKTRLIPALGELGAAELQREMTEHVFEEASELARSHGVSVEVRFAGGDACRMREWLGWRSTCLPQGSGDLGKRMARAFDRAFDRGARRVVMVGSDCPGLDASRIAQACDALMRADVVLGPATDGGYYLLGIRRKAFEKASPALFRDVAWGTGNVLAQTLRRTRGRGIDLALLGELVDVDRPGDVHVWERVRETSLESAAISVVIPTLNEAGKVERAVESAIAAGSEVIVADGSSSDGTREVAGRSGARVVRCRRGRAAQMNAGACTAKGDLLVFLHADTTLPEDYALHVRRTLRRPGVKAGAFRFKVDLAGHRYRILERLVNRRSTALSLPYGDQALFMKTSEFHRLGGFRNVPAMEDVDLVRRLHHTGKIALCSAAAMTSGRRWRERGAFRTALANMLAICAYFGGVSPARIASWRRLGTTAQE